MTGLAKFAPEWSLILIIGAIYFTDGLANQVNGARIENDVVNLASFSQADGNKGPENLSSQRQGRQNEGEDGEDVEEPPPVPTLVQIQMAIPQVTQLVNSLSNLSMALNLNRNLTGGTDLSNFFAQQGAFAVKFFQDLTMQQQNGGNNANPLIGVKNTVQGSEQSNSMPSNEATPPTNQQIPNTHSPTQNSGGGYPGYPNAYPPVPAATDTNRYQNQPPPPPQNVPPQPPPYVRPPEQPPQHPAYNYPNHPPPQPQYPPPAQPHQQPSYVQPQQPPKEYPPNYPQFPQNTGNIANQRPASNNFDTGNAQVVSSIPSSNSMLPLNIYINFNTRPEEDKGSLTKFVQNHPEEFLNQLIQNINLAVTQISGRPVKNPAAAGIAAAIATPAENNGNNNNNRYQPPRETEIFMQKFPANSNIGKPQASHPPNSIIAGNANYPGSPSHHQPQQQQQQNNMRPSRPIYWMNMYYPDGLVTNANVVTRTDDSSTPQPDRSSTNATFTESQSETTVGSIG